jgi:hypothetical protein
MEVGLRHAELEEITGTLAGFFQQYLLESYSLFITSYG